VAELLGHVGGERLGDLQRVEKRTTM